MTRSAEWAFRNQIAQHTESFEPLNTFEGNCALLSVPEF